MDIYVRSPTQIRIDSTLKKGDKGILHNNTVYFCTICVCHMYVLIYLWCVYL